MSETTVPTTSHKVSIPDRLYFRIGDVAELIGVKPYVLRYWESEFPMINPQKSASGQRVYRRSDVETVLMIKHLLYEERYSIEGARKRIRELRKEGELKTFKEETVAAASQPVEVGADSNESQLTQESSPSVPVQPAEPSSPSVANSNSDSSAGFGINTETAVASAIAAFEAIEEKTAEGKAHGVTMPPEMIELVHELKALSQISLYDLFKY